MKRSVILPLLTFALTSLSFQPALAQEAESATEASLYQRLGGLDPIVAVVADFATRLREDPELSRHFGGFSDDRFARFVEFNVQLICASTGGPCKYLGRDMLTTHKGAKISSADFNRVAGHLVATLNKFKVPAKEQGELLNIIAPLRGDIVEVE